MNTYICDLQCALTHLISSCQVDHASRADYTRGHSSSHRSPAKSNGLHLYTVAHTMQRTVHSHALACIGDTL
jgi:hypothetical protein